MQAQSLVFNQFFQQAVISIILADFTCCILVEDAVLHLKIYPQKYAYENTTTWVITQYAGSVREKQKFGAQE